MHEEEDHPQQKKKRSFIHKNPKSGIHSIELFTRQDLIFLPFSSSSVMLTLSEMKLYVEYKQTTIMLNEI